MVIVELCCDHPECARRNRVLRTVPDFVQARMLIDSSQVRCPVHGVRTDPLVVGRGGPNPGP